MKTENLKKMTVAQLKARAKDQGLSRYSNLRKDQLVKMLSNPPKKATNGKASKTVSNTFEKEFTKAILTNIKDFKLSDKKFTQAELKKIHDNVTKKLDGLLKSIKNLEPDDDLSYRLTLKGMKEDLGGLESTLQYLEGPFGKKKMTQWHGIPVKTLDKLIKNAFPKYPNVSKKDRAILGTIIDQLILNAHYDLGISY